RKFWGYAYMLSFTVSSAATYFFYQLRENNEIYYKESRYEKKEYLHKADRYHDYFIGFAALSLGIYLANVIDAYVFFELKWDVKQDNSDRILHATAGCKF
ncbi:MAG: hypothetical protein OEZ38_13620, partial [Gammaproteobacteria bacterium]|nr:hypothetical protein [Gammaproteobacteria bacterium]